MLLRGARAEFMRHIDLAAIEAATRDAESRTTGDIRVSILFRVPGQLESIAEKTAARLGMKKTRDRNGVLILVEPAKRRFIVWGDKAIHEKVGQSFWTETAAAISGRFRQGDFNGGLLHGVAQVGRQLAAHFPCRPGEHEDELPNTVDVS
jgi:uncharacterized membrane protein